MIILSGGTGTPKLLIGMKKIFPESELKIVVNTAEDVWISGNLVCPDIDAVIYALAGVIDEERWWGIRNDTFKTHEALLRLGCDEKLKIGDLDRATHIFRSEMLRRGLTLSEATSMLASRFGISAEVIPMTDESAAVKTKILTDEGEMHFQDFWVLRGGKPSVRGVRFEGVERVQPSERFKEVLEEEDFVLIGPSNPITSISPILSLRGVRERLKEKKVLAVSPIIGGRPVSGPAAALMRACGFEVSAEGVLKCYEDFLDALVIDEQDECRSGSCKILKAKILMRSEADSVELAKTLKQFFNKI